MEIKPLLHFSESVLYYNRQVSHYFHSADEETEGPMAGKSIVYVRRNQAADLQAEQIDFHLFHLFSLSRSARL